MRPLPAPGGRQPSGSTGAPVDGPEDLLLVNNGAGSVVVYAEYPKLSYDKADHG
jgi:hypothetical protein